MEREIRRTRLEYAGVIERLRRERGMTREALAESSGVSASYLSEVERGFKRPSTDVLAKIAQALGMAPSELLAVVEDFSSQPGSDELSRQAPRAPAAPGPAREADLMERFRAHRVPSIAPPATRKSRLAASFSQFFAQQEPERSKEQLLETLITQSNRLDAEDLKVLVDLARRLAEKRR